MPDWPTDWPPELRELLTQRAAAEKWGAPMEESVRMWIDMIRARENSARTFLYYHSATWWGDGHDCFFKVIPSGRNELTVVRQLVVGPTGIHRYWWQAPGDDFGFITDENLDPNVVGMLGISEDQFDRQWAGEEEAPSKD